MNYKENSKAKKISENLNNLINHHSLSFRGLSKATGIAQPHLSRLSKGEHASPGLEVLEKISNFFEISIAQLIGEQKIDFNSLSNLGERPDKQIQTASGMEIPTNEGFPEKDSEEPQSEDEASPRPKF
jgi:transcriptional regulator with XRE-family HTH domain